MFFTAICTEKAKCLGSDMYRKGKMFVADNVSSIQLSWALRCSMMVFMLFWAHSVSWRMIGTSERPVSVSEYSTLGGTS